MPKLLKITLTLIFSLSLLIVMAWLGVAFYINSHKKQIIATITQKFKDNTNGELSIADMKPSLWKSFPNISLSLLNIAIYDSLYEQHGHELVKAKKLYVQVNTWRLITGHTEVRKATVADGSVYLFTDSTGYKNTSIFSKKNHHSEDTSKTHVDGLIKKLSFDNVRFCMDEHKKNKRFNLLIHSFDAEMKQLSNDKKKLVFKTNVLFEDFAFNLDNGSFLKNQEVSIDGYALLDMDEMSIEFPKQPITVGGEKLLFAGNFYPSRKPFAFRFTAEGDKVNYATASKFLSPNITEKLQWFQLSKPVGVKVTVDGIEPFKGTPHIRAEWIVKHTEVKSRFGTVHKGSFKGYYHNEVDKDAEHTDENSEIHISNFSGNWNNIPITAKRIVFSNLKLPYLDLICKAGFPLTAMNQTLGGDAFSFSGGNATADIHYKGGILVEDTRPYTINGSLKIRKGKLSYIPYKLPLHDLNADILFKGVDVYFRNMSMQSERSSLTLDGDARNLLRFYFSHPDNIVINLNMKSPMIDMDEFKGFLTKNEKNRAIAEKKHKKNKEGLNRIGDQLGLALDASTINLNAVVNKLTYNSFTATNIDATTYLTRTGIKINKVSLNHAGGSIYFEGLIHQNQENNPFEAKAIVKSVQVAGIFKAFDNFGQNAIEAGNLEGRISANAQVNGKMTESGGLLTNSLKGYVDFKLEDGVLKQYDPLLKISKIAFKKRNLSHVTFRSIQNRLEVDGSKITINPMVIRSSALNMRIRGTYQMPTGTDIFIEIPLKNPKKHELEQLSEVDSKHLNKKGIVVYLRARDGDENGVKISWDPFKKYLKEHEIEDDDNADLY